ncbi:MAG TPA: UDP-N-acetylmuramoyl-L-alanine--D-glutamate ligase [Candidatus Dormibacteraeota bacterium]|nr:UDP-N-acetylmuramoyl-L-alanine--D-glutamate ligase [Candidatus Dormibacteraeota bacterium]
MLEYSERTNALVIGLGRSGLASTAALRERGAAVVVVDEKSPDALRDAITAIEDRGARFVTPDELPALLPGITLAILSPGVPPTSRVVRLVREAGIPAIGEIELAARLCAAPIIAITGTKGKSTTTALIAHLLRTCGVDAVAGGNIGEPLVAAVARATSRSWVVAELSSFQLEGIATLRPRISVLLNIAPDHLDRHASIEEYAEAKFRIVMNQSEGDTIVLDRDDPRLRALEGRFESRGCAARRLWYTLEHDGPAADMSLRGEQIVTTAAGGAAVAVADWSDVPLPGEHNLRNAMAALLAAIAAGCPPASLRAGLRTFVALAHRLQPIAEIDGVLYVDDSKATNPTATVAALRAYDRPVVLVAGGREKGTDFAELGGVMRARVRALVALGEAAGMLARVADGLPVTFASSMEEAVEQARRAAVTGDVVLLSPACASFDMFASAEDRGDRFARAVRLIPRGAHA